jgi:hypothetical protein
VDEEVEDDDHHIMSRRASASSAPAPAPALRPASNQAAKRAKDAPPSKEASRLDRRRLPSRGAAVEARKKFKADDDASDADASAQDSDWDEMSVSESDTDPPPPKPKAKPKGKPKPKGKAKGKSKRKPKAKGKGKRKRKGRAKAKDRGGRRAGNDDDDADLEGSSPYALRGDHPGLIFNASLAGFLDQSPLLAQDLLTGACITELGRQLQERHAWEQRGGVGPPPAGVADLGEAFCRWWYDAAAPSIVAKLGMDELDTPALAKEGCFMPPLGARVRILQLMCEAHQFSVMRPGGEDQNLSAAVIASIREACLEDSGSDQPFIMPMNIHLATCVKEGTGVISEPCYSHGRRGHLAARTTAFRVCFSAFATLAGFASCRLESVVTMESQHDLLDLGSTPLHAAGRAFLGLDEKGPSVPVRHAEHPACLHLEKSRHLPLVARVLASQVHAVVGIEACRIYGGIVQRLHQRGFLHEVNVDWPGHPSLPPRELGAESASLASRSAVVTRTLNLEMERLGVGPGLEDADLRRAFLATTPEPADAAAAQNLLARGLERPVCLQPKKFLAEEKRLAALYKLEPSAQAKLKEDKHRPATAFSGVLGSLRNGVVCLLDWPPMCTAPGQLALDRGGGPISTLEETVGPARVASGLVGDGGLREITDVKERGRKLEEALTETGICFFDVFGENDGGGPIRAGTLRSPSLRCMEKVGKHRLALLLRAGAASKVVLDVLLLTEMERDLVLELLEPGEDTLGDGLSVLEHKDLTDIHAEAEAGLLGVLFGRRKVVLISYECDGARHAIRFQCLSHRGYQAQAALGQGLRGIQPDTLFSYFDGGCYAAACWVRSRLALPGALPHPLDDRSPMPVRDLSALLRELGQ